MGYAGVFHQVSNEGAAYATASVIDPRSTTRSGFRRRSGRGRRCRSRGRITQPRGKHLRVLQSAGIVHSVRSGRESRFEFDPQPLIELQEYLGRVSAQWDQVLSRLKTLVES
jgi:hypothetical protein